MDVSQYFSCHGATPAVGAAAIPRLAGVAVSMSRVPWLPRMSVVAVSDYLAVKLPPDNRSQVPFGTEIQSLPWESTLD